MVLLNMKSNKWTAPNKVTIITTVDTVDLVNTEFNSNCQLTTNEIHNEKIISIDICIIICISNCSMSKLKIPCQSLK